jgi:hypothetical protein
MSLWDAFIDDYERRRKDLLKQIELMEARLLHTEKSELERWITTTAGSLEQAKVDLAESNGCSKRPKRSFDQGISRAALKIQPVSTRQPCLIRSREGHWLNRVTVRADEGGTKHSACLRVFEKRWLAILKEQNDL